MLTAHESFQNLKDNIRWASRDTNNAIADLRQEIAFMFYVSMALNVFLAGLVIWAVTK